MKAKIKEKIGNKGARKYLSAQAYHKLSDEEKVELKEILVEDEDTEYETTMQALWPKKFEPKPLVWRRR